MINRPGNMDGLSKFGLWCVCGFLLLTMVFMEKPGTNNSNLALAASTSSSQISDPLKTEAEKIVQSGKNLAAFLTYNGAKKNLAEQKRGMDKYVSVLVVKQKLSQSETYALNNFIVYGTPSTSMYVADQRFLMLNQYKKEKNKLPKTVVEWREMLGLFGQ